MLRRFSVNFAIFSMLIDVLLIDVALYLSTLIAPLVHHLPIPMLALTGRSPYEVSGWSYFVFPLVWLIIFLVFSLYDGRIHLRVADELATLTTGSAFAAVSLSGLLYITSRDTPRSLFIIFIAIACALLLICRIAYRVAFHFHIINGVQPRRILIIGAGSIGREMEKRILENKGFGLQLVGFLDDDPQKRASDPRILGTISETRKIITSYNVDEVVLALPNWASGRVTIIVTALQNLPVKIWVVPDYFSLAVNQARIESVAGLPLMDLRAPALNEYQLLVKRIFDIIITLGALIFALPVMGLVALAIHLDNPGPILFRQRRIGENGRPFYMLKFRSMIVDAEKYRSVIEHVDEKGHIIQDKKRHDPRITRVGRFIRKTSLDELPQLINVLRGEMSLIGPRPELPHLVDQYEPWQRSRFAVPQGITGWWQVNGRSDKPMHLNTEEDLYYVRNYSIWLDLQILMKTFWTVISHRGAA